MILGVLLPPFLAATIAFLYPRLTGPAAALAVLTGTASSVWLALRVAAGLPVTHDLGGWGGALGIQLRADGIASLFLVMTAVIYLVTSLYARSYFAGKDVPAAIVTGYWPLSLILWGGLNALFLSGDAFNLYVCLELTTLSAVALVVLGGERQALAAAMRYLLAAFVGSMLYLLGVALLYSSYGVLDLTRLAALATATPPTILAAALIVAALALKTALFPTHFWLPRAHAAAQAPVSALLSSLVVTGSFYLVIRLWTGVFASVVTFAAGQFIGALGAGAILWGSVQALRQQHLKVMIAYSTVAQIGYLFLVIPLVTSSGASEDAARVATMAWNGGAYHAISHALAKAAMFLAAGVIVRALGSDKILGISGIARRLPVATYAFGIAGMTLIGLPPSGGFVAKWLLLSAAFASGQWWWAVVMLIGGVLTAGYVFLVLGQELSMAPSDDEVELRAVPRTLEYAAMALALAALVLGVRVTEPLALLRVGLPIGP